jgi:hypothetical protein
MVFGNIHPRKGKKKKRRVLKPTIKEHVYRSKDYLNLKGVGV